MNEPFAILFQKASEEEANDSIAKWGIACTSFPFKLDGGAKDLATRDWPGEDGEDAFIPDVLPLKAYDLTVDMVYVGPLGQAYDNIMEFRDYMTGADGKGASLKVYNSHTKIGRQGVYWLEMGDIKFSKEADEEVLQFPLKLRVSDPKTSITTIITTTPATDTEPEKTTITLDTIS